MIVNDLTEEISKAYPELEVTEVSYLDGFMTSVLSPHQLYEFFNTTDFTKSKEIWKKMLGSRVDPCEDIVFVFERFDLDVLKVNYYSKHFILVSLLAEKHGIAFSYSEIL